MVSVCVCVPNKFHRRCGLRKPQIVHPDKLGQTSVLPPCTSAHAAARCADCHSHGLPAVDREATDAREVLHKVVRGLTRDIHQQQKTRLARPPDDASPASRVDVSGAWLAPFSGSPGSVLHILPHLAICGGTRVESSEPFENLALASWVIRPPSTNYASLHAK